MTQEEKELLLKKELLLIDLCARLPYGVIVNVFSFWNGQWTDKEILGIDVNNNDAFVVILGGRCEISLVRPYLRQMSSMTEEEIKEFQAFHCVDVWHPDFYQAMCYFPNINNMIGWLDRKMFDHRGLIPMGMALEATEGMYK